MEMRINPDNGQFEGWDGGIFGQGWIPVSSPFDGEYRRISPDNGQIEVWDGGIFGQGWIPKNF